MTDDEAKPREGPVPAAAPKSKAPAKGPAGSAKRPDSRAEPAPDETAAAPCVVAPAGAGTEAPESPSETEGLKDRVAAIEDKVRRQAAEFVNETRRIQRQADERLKYAVQPLVEDLLAVADAIHNAIEGLKDTEHERRVADGLAIVERTLLETLGRYGVQRIDAQGKPFDPTIHQAILETESEGPPSAVVQVVRPGFTLHGRVVRPAHVIVSKAKPAPAPGAAAGRESAPPPESSPQAGGEDEEA